MKTIEPLDYVKLAVSKDKTRYNLTEVYRDKNQFVATDGHRLHMSNGLKDATPGYLSGLDADFPNYNQVIPKGEPSATVTLKTSLHYHREILPKLKAMQKFVACWDKVHSGVALEITQETGGVLLSFNRKKDIHISLRLNTDALDEGIGEGGNLKIGLDLNYLIDALSFADQYNAVLNFHGKLGPVLIKSESGPFSAIVMPLKLPEDFKIN